MDRPRRPEPEKQVLPGLCENQPPPPATAPVRLAGSCLAHRAQQTAKVGFRNIRAYPHHCAADLDLHALRSWPHAAPPAPRRSIFAARRAAARRQAKSCDGVISSERASAEMFVPGSSDAAIARSLKSSDQRRRSPTGAPSSRSARTSMNWFVLVLRIGVDIDVAIHVQPLPNTRPAPPEWRRVYAYDTHRENNGLRAII